MNPLLLGVAMELFAVVNLLVYIYWENAGAFSAVFQWLALGSAAIGILLTLYGIFFKNDKTIMK